MLPFHFVSSVDIPGVTEPVYSKPLQSRNIPKPPCIQRTLLHSAEIHLKTSAIWQIMVYILLNQPVSASVILEV